MHIDNETLRAARVIWNFHVLGHQPIPGDIVIAFGTNDLRVAEFAADLFLRGYGKWLICTGGIAHQEDLLKTPWEAPESEMFAEAAIRNGVPRDRVLLESRALNTAENVRFSRALVESLGLTPRNAVIAVKPFMQRRAWATWSVEWPEMPATVASPPLDMDRYFTSDLPAEKILHILMGDTQRLWVYGRKSWSAPQRFPAPVVEAYHYLKSKGWTRHLLSTEEDLS